MPMGSDTGTTPAWPCKLALTLLYHLARGPASPLLPYIAHLPGLAPGVPTPRIAASMYDDAVYELQYTPIVKDVLNQKYWLKHISEQVLGHLLVSTDGSGTGAPASGSESESERASSSGGLDAAGGGGATAEEAAEAAARVFGGLTVDAALFGWAVAVATSRFFGSTRLGTHTCVPLADMANHVAPYSASNCDIRTGPEGQVEMVTKRRIRAGEELTLTYGTIDNHNLLLSYGFTLESNPYDAFYFDLDLEIVEALVKDWGPLAPWQLELLESKLGLRRKRAAEGAAESGGSGGSGAVRIYLSSWSTAPLAALGSEAAEGDTEGQGEGAAQAAEVAGPDADAEAEAGPGRPTAGDKVLVQQPVDPMLLAALRIATLQDESWYRILSPQSVEQIGDWDNVLIGQQDIRIMRLLVVQLSTSYATFPTTLLQDSRLLDSVSIDAAAAVTLTTPAAAKPAPDAGSGASSVGGAGQRPSGGGWVLRPHDVMTGSLGAGLGSGDGDDASAAAAHARDMVAAIRFRMSLKITIRKCVLALADRAMELSQLEK